MCVCTVPRQSCVMSAGKSAGSRATAVDGVGRGGAYAAISPSSSPPRRLSRRVVPFPKSRDGCALDGVDEDDVASSSPRLDATAAVSVAPSRTSSACILLTLNLSLSVIARSDLPHFLCLSLADVVAFIIIIINTRSPAGPFDTTHLSLAHSLTHASFLLRVSSHRVSLHANTLTPSLHTVFFPPFLPCFHVVVSLQFVHLLLVSTPLNANLQSLTWLTSVSSIAQNPARERERGIQNPARERKGEVFKIQQEREKARSRRWCGRRGSR